VKEIFSIISHYHTFQTGGLLMALAIVVHAEQSSYRRSGARMLITADGKWVGGISGGCLEGDVLKKASYAIHSKQPTTIRYDTREDDPNQIGVGLGCNGLLDIVIIPLNKNYDNLHPIKVLEKLSKRRVPSVLVTNLNNGHTLDTFNQMPEQKRLVEAVESAKSTLESNIFESEHAAYFIEVIKPSIHLYIFGCNYDVIPLIRIANNIGWFCKIVANPGKVSKYIFELSSGILDIKKGIPTMDEYSIPLIMGHDYKQDMEVLSCLTIEQYRYVGLLGPKKRKEKMLKELRRKGKSVQTNSLFGPMGLDTGADSPEEIAISIIAEIRAVFSGRKGGSLRERTKGIYEK